LADLESVISASIASAGDSGGDSGDAGDSGGDAVETAVDDTAVEGADPEVVEGAEPETPAEPAAESEPVAEGEVAPVIEPKKKGSLPLHRHEAILAKARKDHQVEIDAVKAENASLAWAKDPEAKATFDAFALADQNPDAFARGVLSVPALAVAFQKAVSGMAAPAAPVAAAAKAPAGSRPGPDLPDGGYSEDGLQALLDWNAAKVVEQVEQKYEERFGPIEKDFNATTKWNKAIETQRGVLNNARETWPGFKDHEPAIFAHMKKPGNERMKLEQAHREVVFPALQASRDAMRAEIIKELNGKPAAATPRPAVRTATPAAGGKKDLTDVIKNSLANAAAAAA